MNRKSVYLVFLSAILLLLAGCGPKRENSGEKGKETGELGIITDISFKYNFKYTQDGAIYGNEAFLFRHDGRGSVYDLSNGRHISDFRFPDKLIPHVNSACFSRTFYEEGDTYPVLYVSFYNARMDEPDPMWGTCMAYRIQKENGSYLFSLLQVIRLEYVDSDIWKKGYAWLPYGNFVVDTDRSRLIAFNLKDDIRKTRFYEMALPDIREGNYSEEWEAMELWIPEEEIVNSFDVPFEGILQGVCYRNGRIYSAEGNGVETDPSRVRVIDLGSQKLVQSFPIAVPVPQEAEFLDFYGDRLIYGDVQGQMYELTVR